MSSLTRAHQLRDQLVADGVRAVTSARSVVPPCVLITPPLRTYDMACGYTATWQLYAIAPGGGDEGSWQALDALVDDVAELLPIETANATAWRSAADAAESMPAYLLTFTETVDTSL